MAEHNLQIREPTTHTRSKHWREWLLCEDYSLTHEELQQFYDYYKEANILFEGQDQRWDLIKQLSKLYFGEQKVSGKQFMRLGFQGQYPQTDFRGGGVLGLKLILRFTESNIDLVRVMQKDPGNFFFAITAINLAFFMKKYFHLADFLEPERDEQQYCNRRALKNFCSIIISERFTFEQMHQMFLKYFYNNMWVPSFKNNPQTLLQFNSLFENLKKKIRQTFQCHTINDFHSFINIWRQVI